MPTQTAKRPRPSTSSKNGKGSSPGASKANENGRAGAHGPPSGVNPALPEGEWTKRGAGRFEPIRTIRVRGAREHNLKAVNVDIPRDRLVVVTGLSGSGKSSLAFDTVFAEGQRKYMESLSAYARQFLDQLKKPDVEDIEGLPPTIAIEQRSSGRSPRSTVATSTEIYDYLRLLFARVGTPTCWSPIEDAAEGSAGAAGKKKKTSKAAPKKATKSKVTTKKASTKKTAAKKVAPKDADEADEAAADLSKGASDVAATTPKNGPPRCGLPISRMPPSQITEQVARLKEGTRLMVLSPVIRSKKGFHREVLEDFSKQGFVRARVNGDIVELSEVLEDASENPLKLGRYEKHTIEAVVDRLTIRDGARARLSDSLETALKLAGGVATVAVQRDDKSFEETTYSEHHACAEHPHCSLEELEPRLFSFNSPHGACPECHGLGVLMEFDPALVLPDPGKAISKSGIAPWTKAGPAGMFSGRLIRRFCRKFDVSPSTKIGNLTPRERTLLLYGTTKEQARNRGASWDGVIPQLAAWFEKTESNGVREFLQQFMGENECRSCKTDRLSLGALAVFVRSKEALPDTSVKHRTRHGLTDDPYQINIADFTHLTIEDAVRIIGGLELTPEQEKIAAPIVREVVSRLGFLASVGLDYLSLDRKTSTLSGGEAQRIRLATQVGSGIVGAAYVLDEPTIGLHPRDNTRLIKTLRHLADIGNSVVVVEHDEEMIRAADHVIDMGPGPGVHGGTVVAEGSIPEIQQVPESLTGDYLAGRRKVETPKPKERRKVSGGHAVVVKGARANNLKNIDVSFPLGGLVCVTGVSGSGKSTLVNDILVKVARGTVTGSRNKPGAHTRVNGLTKVDRVVEVDQSPIGRTPRSNPATYTSMFDEIRKVFAQAPESRVRGYSNGRFSFNVKGGRCEACQGQGQKRIAMHFLADVFVTCEVCDGTRYNRETLDVVYRGKTIADVLAMTSEDAAAFFEHHPRIARVANCMVDVGLAYVTLGQPSTTLSGGEAQRVKLATELWKGGGLRGKDEHTLYVLDEPTTGLHFEDVRKLVSVFDRLADQGNTLVIIEHNLDVLKRADWIIDLGPEGGSAGGTVVAEGPPEVVAKSTKSYTGKYLKPLLRA